MPALVFCRRRWLNGSDDFVFQGFLSAVWHAALAVAAFSLLQKGRLNQNSAYPAHCPGSTDGLSSAVLAQMIVNLVALLVCWFLAVASLRGRILEPSKRKAVPYALGALWMVTIACIAASSACIHFIYVRHEIRFCPSSIAAGLHFLVAGNVMFYVFVIFSWCFKIDPAGHRQHHTLRQSEADYLALWHARCNCCAALFCIFDAGLDKHELLDDVTVTMARLFDAHDAVLSDIAAGLVLLHHYQRQQLNNNILTLRWTLPAAEAALKAHGNMSLAREVRPMHPLLEADRNDLHKLQHFSKYYLAAYGYLLYWYQQLFSGMPRLWVTDCVMCCRKRPHQHPRSGDCCYCNMTALRKVAKLESEDILLTSWENEVLLPAFYVAIDHATTSLVIAIRGSLSLKDCITDVVAQPKLMPVADLDESGPSYVHGGMLKSAEKVLDRLTDSNIIRMMVDGAYSTHNIVIVGHSLGAGVAAILAIRLRDKYPQIRPRLQAMSYAPPGGLFSKRLSEYTDSFVTCTLLGKDLVPRLTAHAMNDLRDSLFLAIAASGRSKARIMASACCLTGVCTPDELPDRLEASDEELRLVMEMLRPSAELNPDDRAATMTHGSRVNSNTRATASSGITAMLDTNNISSGSTPREMVSISPLRPQPGRSFEYSNPSGGTSSAAAAAAGYGPATPTASQPAMPGPGAGTTASGNHLAAPTQDHARHSKSSGGDTIPFAAGLGNTSGNGPSSPMLRPPHDLKLYPPNRIYHFLNAADRPDACGCLCGDPGTAACCSFKEYWPQLTCPEELQEVVVSPMMVLDHFPDRLFFALQHAMASVDAQRLQPLVVPSAHRPGPAGDPANGEYGSGLAFQRMLYRPNVDVITTHRRVPVPGGSYGATRSSM